MSYGIYSPGALQVVALGLRGSDVIDDTIAHVVSNLRIGLVSATTINEGGTFTATDVTLTVTSGAVFPAAIAATRPRYILIGAGTAVGGFDAAKKHNPGNYEILQITAVSSNDLTVVRGALGTQAMAHDDGATVYHYTEHDRWVAALNLDSASPAVFDAGCTTEHGDAPEEDETVQTNGWLGPLTKIILKSGGGVRLIRG